MAYAGSPPRLKALITEINRQCKSLGSNDDLTWELKNDLESLSAAERGTVVGCVINGCAPLFKACRVGNLKVARYLIEKCGADIDQRGMSIDGTQQCHSATPLWCAAVKGFKNLVTFLLAAGANINAVTDTGSTAVRSACFSSQFEIVEILVNSGADIEQPNHNGGTCLINSVQSPELCSLLLDHGAAVNVQDVQGKSALHYAVEENVKESVDLLVGVGADLYAKTIDGDSPARLACYLGRGEIAMTLMDEMTALSPKDRADNLALLGATLFEQRHDMQQTTAHFWKTALMVREHAEEEAPGEKSEINAIEKNESSLKESKPPDLAGSRTTVLDCPLFDGKKEFENSQELNTVLDEIDAVRVQSLLITQRVLGWNHPETMQRFLMRGGAFAESGRLREATWLWMEILARELAINGILGEYSLFLIAGSILQLMSAYAHGMGPEGSPAPLTADMAIQVIELILSAVTKSREWLEIRPQSKAQSETFDDVLSCIPYFLHFAADVDHNNPRLLSLCSILGKANTRMFVSNASLLHTAASSSNRIHTKSMLDLNGSLPDIYPSERVVRVLLKSGWNPNVVDRGGCTPLHCAIFPLRRFEDPRRTSVINLLMGRGCHVDRVDNMGRSPYEFMPPANKKPLLSLKCLAAQKLGQAVSSGCCEEDLSHVLPAELLEFVAMHADSRQRDAMHLRHDESVVIERIYSK